MQTYQQDRWAALGDPTRRAVFERVTAGPCAVGEIALGLPVTRPAVSQHLKVLKSAGLVLDEPVGNRRIYRADPAGIAALRAELDSFWASALTSFKSIVEAQPEKGGQMNMSDTETTVRQRVVVDVPQERAFAVFTEDFDKIKPREHNLLSAPIEETVLEPKVGGKIYDRGADGSECHWGRVLAFEPPDRLVFSWDISPKWQIEEDKDRTSEVEIRFVPDGPERTRVELEHRHLDRHGEGWQNLRGGVDAGWTVYLSRYVDLFS